MPLALDDAAMQMIIDASAPIDRRCRGDFLEAIAAELAAHPPTSPAALRELIRATQLLFWSPPRLGHEVGTRSKWR